MSEPRALLLVEDNEVDAVIVERLLVGSTYVVTRAATVAAAEQALAAARFQVVALDLNLPDAEPLDVVQRVLFAAAGTPVVALTQMTDTLADECLQAGLQDFVHKRALDAKLLLRALDHAVLRGRGAEMARRLELAERQATLGSIASYVAHEVNNQLSLLSAALELAQGGTDVAANLDEGRRTVERIASIVRQLQVLGDRKGPGAACTDVAALVERSVAAMANRLRQSAMVSLDLGRCGPAAIEEQRLAQVLVNLLRNAAEAVTGDPARQRIRVELREAAQQVILSISDTGPGIPASDLPHIFRPFFSTKPEGTGVGLAISAEIVASALGTLTVSSSPGGGSTFVVTLPRAASAAPPRMVSIPGSAPRRRVLLIDDDARLRITLGALLRRHHDLVEAGSGAEGLRVLEDDQDFDAVFCDLMMPGLDGTAVYAAVQRLYPELVPRFVLLTGGGFTPAARALADSGRVRVLSKPSSVRDVLRAIEDLAMLRST